jgi:CRP-like cAMP-binding protein
MIPPPRNRLLATLSDAALRHLPRLRPVALTVRQVIEAAGEPIPYVYFVETGLLSIVGITRPHHRIEVGRIEIGMIGPEGMSGSALLLGSDRAVSETMVQAEGTALRLSTADLQAAMKKSPAIARLFLRYVHVFMIQTSQTALANGRGVLTERLARWILMWADRLESDEIAVSHAFLSLLLGVRRAGVTEALHRLEALGLVRSTRTLIKILDRERLKDEANGFYGIPEAEYARLIGVATSAESPRPLPVAA